MRLKTETIKNIIKEWIKFASKNSPVEAFECFHFKANGDELTISSHNGDTWYTATIPNIKENIDMLVQAYKFYNYVKFIDSETIEVKLDSGKCLVKADDEYIKIPTVQQEPFQKPNTEKQENYCKVDYNKFKVSIDQVGRAVWKRAFKPMLLCVNMKFKEDKLILAGTDTFRLGKKTMSINNNNLLLDINVDNNYLSQLPKDREVAYIKADDRLFSLYFKLDGYKEEMHMVLNQESFPDYNQIIPSEKGKEALYSIKELKQAIHKASIVTEDLWLDVVGKEVSVSAIWEFSADIQHEWAEYEVRVDWNHLEKVLWAFEAPTISMYYNWDMLTFTSEIDDNLTYILKPLTNN